MSVHVNAGQATQTVLPPPQVGVAMIVKKELEHPDGFAPQRAPPTGDSHTGQQPARAYTTQREMRVLVVGDKEHERSPVAEAIRALGHFVTEAPDGTHAWESFCLHHYDAVFSDYLMPEMDGFELCRQIRLGPHAEYTYFVIVSARSEADNLLKGFRSGVDDYLPKPVGSLELECRLITAERVCEVHRKLAQSNADLLLLSEELRAESRKDALTGVGNRLRFRDDLKRFLDAHKRYGHQFFLGMCDIDNFKKYNDAYGHLEGDRVLKSVAETLAGNCRTSDCCYRFGGEEFLLVFVNQSRDGAVSAAERLRVEIEGLNIRHGQNDPHGKVTLSIGLAEFLASSSSEVEGCLKLADNALYQSKSNGRNRVTEATSLS